MIKEDAFVGGVLVYDIKSLSILCHNVGQGYLADGHQAPRKGKDSFLVDTGIFHRNMGNHLIIFN